MKEYTFTFFGEMPDGATEHDMRIVLMDALAEYVAHRDNGNGSTYVDRRYPGDAVYRGEDRIRKAASVSLRCRVANWLHNFWINRADA